MGMEELQERIEQLQGGAASGTKQESISELVRKRVLPQKKYNAGGNRR
jgi:hypothetical protein